MGKIELEEITRESEFYNNASQSLAQTNPPITKSDRETILLDLFRLRPLGRRLALNHGMWLAAKRHSALPNYLRLVSLLCMTDVNPLQIIELLSTRHENGHTLLSLIHLHKRDADDDDDDFYYETAIEQYLIILVKLAGLSTPVVFELFNSGLMSAPQLNDIMLRHFAKYKGEIRDYICALPESTPEQRQYKIETIKHALDENHPLCQIFCVQRGVFEPELKAGSFKTLQKVLDRLEQKTQPGLDIKVRQWLSQFFWSQSGTTNTRVDASPSVGSDELMESVARNY